MAWELVHIDLHKRRNIKWEDSKKKKYIAGVIDDATRIIYSEVLPNKKAKTLASFMKRAYKWFQKKWITIKKLLSDNGLEFTSHHIHSRPQHSFEKMLDTLQNQHFCTKNLHKKNTFFRHSFFYPPPYKGGARGGLFLFLHKILYLFLHHIRNLRIHR